MPNAASKPSPITASVDLARDGVQHGHLKLPYSRDDSAWGALMIPITVVKRGSGPTALLTGANHGDEYEGPVALFDLARSLRPEEVTGRVIILPAMNYAAFRAGTRTSPIDKGNMNRIFPGRADGTVTEKIADYIQRHLLPMADVVLDIHSGGKTLEFVPFAASHRLPDKAQEARCVAAMAAFNAPYSVMLLELDAVGMYDTAAEAMGKIFVSTELGGGGTARPDTIAVTKRGIRNLLIHAGIIEGKLEQRSSIHLDMPDGTCYVTCTQGGLIEYCVALGDSVTRGKTVALVYDVERTGSAVAEYRAGRDGIVAGRHFPGLVQTGDTIAVIGVPVGAGTWR
ncbi:MAG TPA: N(2)-acetyl-L-2,4-diaminobutanoate deacetylase DoeB [Stellaceae bacterium]|jgi:N-alpha-acetyl-L-2,4-diaminobutyrate deacetylase|nr:N(2)-acetyl-L-2,4-diaminobutanoate deacetylase DoeB [Stellaceae bacterium]